MGGDSRYPTDSANKTTTRGSLSPAITHGSFDRSLLIEHAPPLAVAADIDAGEANRERLGLGAL